VETRLFDMSDNSRTEFDGNESRLVFFVFRLGGLNIKIALYHLRSRLITSRDRDSQYFEIVQIDVVYPFKILIEIIFETFKSFETFETFEINRD
jgi:hypothetical protein